MGISTNQQKKQFVAGYLRLAMIIFFARMVEKWATAIRIIPLNIGLLHDISHEIHEIFGVNDGAVRLFVLYIYDREILTKMTWKSCTCNFTKDV